MKPEKQQLIDELFDGESRREATLLSAAKVLRRRRRWPAARSGLAVMLCLALAGVLIKQKESRPPVQIASQTPKTASAKQPQSLTDEELLALFPNTPVGLATLPNGKKLLVFPRPGDEARFITKL